MSYLERYQDPQKRVIRDYDEMGNLLQISVMKWDKNKLRWKLSEQKKGDEISENDRKIFFSERKL